MTKVQKSLFKQLKKDKHREAFFDMLVGQQTMLGKCTHWAPQYLRKCRRKKVKPIAAVKDVA
jgi:hypothetical protein